MKNIGFNGFKFLLLWLTLLISSVLGSLFIDLGGTEIGMDGPFTGGQAFLIVNGLHAAVLGLIAANAHVRGWILAALITITVYMVQSFLMLMEALYFNESLGLSVEFLLNGSAHVLFTSVWVGLISALLWRSPPAQRNQPLPLERLPIRFACITILYIVAYFSAGFLIAWRAESVRDYYGDGINIQLLPLIAFQLIRGPIWAGLALFIVRSLNGSRLQKAGVVGIAFSVLATAQLLYPNDFMPWDVRLPHMIEVTISNFIFGALAALILTTQKRSVDPVGRDQFQPHQR